VSIREEPTADLKKPDLSVSLSYSSEPVNAFQQRMRASILDAMTMNTTPGYKLETIQTYVSSFAPSLSLHLASMQRPTLSFCL
jgi:hypothetical protein